MSHFSDIDVDKQYESLNQCIEFSYGEPIVSKIPIWAGIVMFSAMVKTDDFHICQYSIFSMIYVRMNVLFSKGAKFMLHRIE